jgi:endonuclease YncB( thermonuclease family)
VKQTGCRSKIGCGVIAALGILVGLILMLAFVPGSDESARPRPTTTPTVTTGPASAGLPDSTLIAMAPAINPVIKLTPTLFAEPTPSGQRAFVQSVVDGDTIRVMIDGVEFTVRYLLVNTPERGEMFYREATRANEALVSSKSVILVKDVSETDRYGRLLRYVYLEDGTFVNREMVRQGWAQVSTFPPDVSKEPELRAAQRQAMSTGAGIWSLISGPVTNRPVTLRGGPGNDFPEAGHLIANTPLTPVTVSPDREWLQLADGTWIAAIAVNNVPPLVDLRLTAQAITPVGVAPLASDPCAGVSLPAPNPACPIKGNINSKGEQIFHMPGQRDYCKTTIDESAGEEWFCSAAQAEAAGWRAATR